MTTSLVRSPPSRVAVKAAAMLELRRRKTSLGQGVQPTFDAWLRAHYDDPKWNWDWPHVRVMVDTMDKVARGELKRVMFFLPPRHGKTETVTVRFLAYSLAMNPTSRFILGAYNQTLASLFSRKVRRLVTAKGPAWALSLSPEQKAKSEWEVTQGGGVVAAGVGGGVTGRGADGVAMDDPVKNREEAHSPAFQEKTYGWYTNDILTRLEPEAWMVLIMTRWAEGDLAGRILNGPGGDTWTVVRLPGLAESQEDRDSYNESIKRPLGQPEPIGRAVGQALCPDRFTADYLKDLEVDMGTLDWLALIQQRPSGRQGSFFRREWFSIVPGLSQEDLKKARLVRYWDKAGSVTAGSARTAGVLVAKVARTFYVLDVVSGRWEAGDRESVIDQVALSDRKKYGRVTIYHEQEPGSGGKESAQATTRRLSSMGYVAKADRVTGDKVVRAEPAAGLAQVGSIKLVAAEWNHDYLNQLTAFPHGAAKDMVDGTSGAINKLATGLSVFLKSKEGEK